jgi:hypothetical protein
MVKQRTKRARPDIVGADQPQVVDTLGVGELNDWGDGVHDSTPGRATMAQPVGVGKGLVLCRLDQARMLPANVTPARPP